MTTSIAFLHSRHSWIAHWNDRSLSCFPSSLFITPFLFHTLLVLTQVLPASHMSCPCTITENLCSSRPEQALAAPRSVFIPDEEHVRWPIHSRAFIFIPVLLQNAQEYLANNTHPSFTLKTPFLPPWSTLSAEECRLSRFGWKTQNKCKCTFH